MLKSEDTISILRNFLQLVRKMEDIVLLAKMTLEAENVPAVVTGNLFAGPESALKRTIAVPSMGFGKMFPNLLATLKALNRLICDETAMIKRTECIILVLHFPNMLQPFVLSNKRANLRRARVIRAFPFPFNRMFCRSVSVKIMVILERFSVGTAMLSAHEGIRVNVCQMLLHL
jgi:hypothetical protein